MTNSPSSSKPIAAGTSSISPVPEYTAWLEASISRYEALAKQLVTHKPEKGRIVEGVVKSALRAILPGRFSIGSGFAITASGKVSTQLDLVIYDGFYNAPVILEGGVGLFPIECVYGFVEVKSVLDKAAIHSAAKSIATVRSFAEEKRYVIYGRTPIEGANAVVTPFEVEAPLAPRSFVFAINSQYGNIQSVEDELKLATEENRAHVHGLAVLAKNWFISQKPFQVPFEFNRAEEQALARFCTSVLHTVQSIEMRPASMTRYLLIG